MFTVDKGSPTHCAVHRCTRRCTQSHVRAKCKGRSNGIRDSLRSKTMNAMVNRIINVANCCCKDGSNRRRLEGGLRIRRKKTEVAFQTIIKFLFPFTSNLEELNFFSIILYKNRFVYHCQYTKFLHLQEHLFERWTNDQLERFDRESEGFERKTN